MRVCSQLPLRVQEFEIECPDTKSLFSLKTGEITSWCA